MPKWVKGQSGNPAGRPRGSRDKLTKDIIDAFATDFEQHGPETVDRLREVDPRAYLQLAAQLIPKEAAVQVNHRSEAHEAFVNALLAINAKDEAKIIDGEVQEIGETAKPEDDA